jgi:poly-gamma-glutamate synthesis protein (capsule biosynthesis protein)
MKVLPFALGAVLFVTNAALGAESRGYRLLFAGDVLLSREVTREIDSKGGQSPWSQMGNLFKGADWAVGNLEGSVGDPSRCLGHDSSLCFSVLPKYLPLLKQAGFTAMGIENNHSADLGDEGRATTQRELSNSGMAPVSFEDSPGYLRLGDSIVGIIALNHVGGKDGQKVAIPSNALRQKIRLAKALANWVVVYVHWGTELEDWVTPDQREMARWLITEGADLIIGHHPHVVQAPECILGKPVFFSLGNHLFDQKYPETKSGMIADCRVQAGVLACNGIRTSTAPGTSFPVLATNTPAKSTLDGCKVAASAPLKIDGYELHPKVANREFVSGEIVLEGKKAGAKEWTVVAKKLLSLEAGRLTGIKSDHRVLFTLEKHRSSIDQEMGPRPYVYEVTSHGLVAKWRGSALAWPLIDGKLLPSKSGIDYLCALHRKDSFLLLNAASTETRTALYQWNGFGFSGVSDATLNDRCRAMFELKPSTPKT